MRDGTFETQGIATEHLNKGILLFSRYNTSFLPFPFQHVQETCTEMTNRDSIILRLPALP